MAFLYAGNPATPSRTNFHFERGVTGSAARKRHWTQRAQPQPHSHLTRRQLHSDAMAIDSSDLDFESWLTEKLDALGLDAEVCNHATSSSVFIARDCRFPLLFTIHSGTPSCCVPCCTSEMRTTGQERHGYDGSLARLEHSCPIRALLPSTRLKSLRLWPSSR